ncbi:MAG: hypothetical protein LBK55_11390 [Azoarcus sp.]|jgi:hypothetical protein|nr:hypothetical protein [Azoarcus sp.]
MAETKFMLGFNSKLGSNQFTLSPTVEKTFDNGIAAKLTFGKLFDSATGKFNFNPTVESTKTFSDGSTVGIGAGWAGGNTNAFISGSYPTSDGSKASLKVGVVDTLTEALKASVEGSFTRTDGNRALTFSAKSEDGGTVLGLGVSDPEYGKVLANLIYNKDTGLNLKNLALTSPELKDSANGATGSFTASISDLLGNGWSGVKLGVSGKNALPTIVAMTSLLLPDFPKSALVNVGSVPLTSGSNKSADGHHPPKSCCSMTFRSRPSLGGTAGREPGLPL